jgi:hypothetical protein
MIQLRWSTRMNAKKFISFLLWTFALVTFADGAEKTTVGWVERVRLYPGNTLVEARIDTGAELSSLHCDCITPLERDGEKWVSFVVENTEGRPVLMEQKVLRIATIKRHFGELQERMVVKLGVCLGETYKETEITLVDRSGLTYPMLVGRNFLQGDFLVDPSINYKTSPKCRGPGK